MSSLDESSAVHNHQLAFSVLEKELGIPRVMSASDLTKSGQIDKLSMVLYLTQVQNAFTVPAKGKSSRLIIKKAPKKHFCSINICCFKCH